MANNNINVLQTVIQLRRGTEEQWELVKDSFIPREGEPCTTIYDDGRDALVKIGDGKHTWGQLGYTRDSFLVTATPSSEGGVTTDKSLEEILKAVEQNKYVYAKALGFEKMAEAKYLFLPYLGMAEDGDQKILFFGNDLGRLYLIQGGGHFTPVVYMEAEDGRSMPFDAQNKSIVNLADSKELTSAVTRGYTDNSTPTFIYLEEQNGVIQSKTTDLETLKTALMSQTNGYTQTNNPLYKAVKCYAVLNDNCYDLVYSSQENAQEAGKVAIVKRTFYAITTDGLNKLNVVIDENQTDENQKVVWTKEAQGVAAEQFIVTVTDNKSDKTPAEIKAAVEAGKQVVLQETIDNLAYFYYLVNADNDIATFCKVEGMEGTAGLDQIFMRLWCFIRNDKTIIITPDFNIAFFTIEKDDSGKYTSNLNPELLSFATAYGCAANVLLIKDDETFIGTIYANNSEGNSSFHIYFPDYAKNKVYDLKYNGDDPATYTFTELTLGEKPMVVTFTSGNDGVITADKTFEEVDAAYKSGIPIYGRAGVTSQNIVFSLTQEDIENKIYFFTNTRGNESTVISYSATECQTFSGIFMTCESGAVEWDAMNNKIKNLGSPTDASDAATKGYVDNILTAGTNDSVVIKSSTPNSTKKFRITVDDAGTISATEVT